MFNGGKMLKNKGKHFVSVWHEVTYEMDEGGKLKLAKLFSRGISSNKNIFICKIDLLIFIYFS